MTIIKLGDEVMYSALSKFQLVKGNELIAPGKCACHGKMSGEFIDIGLELDFYGVVYLCIPGLVEIANQFNYYSPQQQAVIRNSNTVLREHNNELRKEVENLRGALAAINLVKLPASVVPSDPASTDYPERQVKSEAINSDVGSPLGTSEGEKKLAKLTDEQRSGSVQRDGSLDPFFGDVI